MLKKTSKLISFILITILIVVGCSNTGNTSAGENNSDNSNATTENKSNADQVETRVLRVAHNYPEGHVIHQAGYLTFKKEVEERSGGRLKVDIYPAEQLGSSFDLPDLVREGVADIGEIFPNYYPERFPVGMALSLPGMYEDEWTLFYGLWEVLHEGPIAEEWERNNLVPLLLTASPMTEFLTVDKKIETVADLNNLKLRSTGGAMDFMRNVGVAPVQMALGDIFTGAERGTVDGAVMNYSLANGFGMWELFKYATDGANAFGLGTVAASMDRDNFASLPDDLQQVLYEAGKIATLTQAEAFFANNEEAKQEARDAGVEIVEVSDDFIEEFVAKLSPAYDEYINVVNNAGLDGEAILKDIQETMEHASQVEDKKAVRDFDIAIK